MATNSAFPFATALQQIAQGARSLLRSIPIVLKALIDGTLVVYPRMVVGTIAATATTMTVNLGFAPDAVEVINVTDAKQLNWYSPMTSGTGLLLATTAAAVSSGGVTPITTAGSEGFSVGTNISAPSKFLTYIAYRNRPTA
jgi:hypothetical protein